MRSLILASTSKWRKAEFDRLQLPYVAVSPEFDEEAQQIDLEPQAVALQFALGKAQSLAYRFADEDALIIGSDQVPDIEGQRLHKPQTFEEAEAELSRLQGKTHYLHTGVAVVEARTGRHLCELASVSMKMRSLTPAQIHHYVSVDRPLGSAGGYKIEGLGIALFDQIDGADQSAIVGLPLLVLCRLLRAFGVDPL